MKFFNFFFFGFLLITTSLNAQRQFELKANPLVLVVDLFQIAVEFPVAEDFGLEPNAVIFFGDGFETQIAVVGKYYMNPSEKGNDRFHIGAFVNFITDVGPGIGFYTGYKWVSSKRVTFEIGAGIGRVLGSVFNNDVNITATGQLSVGYRFHGK